MPGMPGLPGLPPGMGPPGAPGLPPGLAGLPGLPPSSMAGGLLSLAGHPGLPPVSMAGGPPHPPHGMVSRANDIRDEKPPISAIEERLKNSSSASPLSTRSGMDGRGRSPAPPGGGNANNARSPSTASVGGGDRRPGSRASEDQQQQPTKRIKTEDSSRKSGHVSLHLRFQPFLQPIFGENAHAPHKKKPLSI